MSLHRLALVLGDQLDPDRHRGRFAGNRRMRFQINSLDRKPEADLRAIRRAARDLRHRIEEGKRV